MALTGINLHVRLIHFVMQKHLLYVLALIPGLFPLVSCSSETHPEDHREVISREIERKDSIEAQLLLDTLRRSPDGYMPSKSDLLSSPIDPPRN